MFDDSNLSVDLLARTRNPLIDLAMNGPIEFKAKMNREAFHVFLLRNEEIRMERDKNGTITIYPPMTYDSAIHEEEAIFHLKYWAKKHKKGKVLSPSGSFALPDGSTHKVDGAWVSDEKDRSLSDDERRSIPFLVPDFVIETRSKTDALSKLKKKMADVWIANGVRLAWLIDPERQKAWIYRANGSVEAVPNFEATLSGEDVLEGFSLDLKELK